MTKNSPARLKLHVEDLPEEQPALDLPQLASLCRAFERSTGWQLRYERGPTAPGEAWSTSIDDGRGPTAGRLVLVPAAAEDDASEPPPAIDLHAARPLALAVGNLVGEVQRLRRALWKREAELAAGVPVAARVGDEPHLAERLEAVLKGGAEAVACQAAGLYLLDDATSELKLRAMWGLPKERLLMPARPLRGAVADLEALVGHAVVLEDTSVLPHWRCPEDFPAAVCVPVSSPSIPLGTLWIFSREPRDFGPEETNLIEIIAGRLAADLEREMLLSAGADAKLRDRQFESAARWLEERLPSVAPLLDEYEVAGWKRAADDIGGDFYDWTVLPDGRLAAAVGEAHGALLEAGLGSAALHSALKSHAAYRHDAADLASRLNDTLWTASPGGTRAGLAYALIDPENGRLQVTLAGGTAAILVRGKDREVLTAGGPPLGESAEVRFPVERSNLAPGQVLLLLSSGARGALDPAGLRIGEASFASLVERHLRDSAEGLLSRLRRLLDHGGQIAEDMTIVVVKRRAERAFQPHAGTRPAGD